MKFRISFLFAALALVSVVHTLAYATDTLFEYKDSKGVFYCRFVENSGWESGIITRNNLFRSFKSEIQRLKRLYRKNNSGKIQIQIKALQKRLNSSSKICGERITATPTLAITTTALPGSTPTIASPANTTPTVAVTNTPTPTTTPTISFFDANGIMSDAGKVFLNIPTNLSAGITEGQALLSQYQCTNCHSERLNRSFDTYKENLRRPPMNFNEVNLPNADLAHITGYLNRFR